MLDICCAGGGGGVISLGSPESQVMPGRACTYPGLDVLYPPLQGCQFLIQCCKP